MYDLSHKSIDVNIKCACLPASAYLPMSKEHTPYMLHVYR
jgi:hypothetical protein